MRLFQNSGLYPSCLRHLDDWRLVTYAIVLPKRWHWVSVGRIWFYLNLEWMMGRAA
jgi:hypothetical protein